MRIIREVRAIGIEKHSEHPNAGWISRKLYVWVSPDGKEAKLIDFASNQRTYRGKLTIRLQCNLSNHGCKETRRTWLEVKPSNLRREVKPESARRSEKKVKQ